MSDSTRTPSGVRSPLVYANRWLLAGVVLAGVFGLLVAAGVSWETAVRRIVATDNGVRYLFSPFIGAIITGTSIVVTITQLVLSQELGAVGDQRERMQAAVTFQSDVKSALEAETTSADPAGFFDALLAGIETRAHRLAAATDADRDHAAAVGEFADELASVAGSIRPALDGATFGSFELMGTVLEFDYTRQLHTARQLHRQHGAALSTDAESALEELVELLMFVGETREHFKTLYFQWALIDLSRALLYTAIPALTLIGGLITYADATAVSGQTFGIDDLVWLTSGGFTVGVTPFVVFAVFILRITTVAKRTLAIGPFVLQAKDER